jgi:hypothetical protein
MPSFSLPRSPIRRFGETAACGATHLTVSSGGPYDVAYLRTQPGVAIRGRQRVSPLDTRSLAIARGVPGPTRGCFGRVPVRCSSGYGRSKKATQRLVSVSRG